MTFTEIYSDANFDVSISWGTSYVYRMQRNYIKVVFKNFATENNFKFNGYTYFGYKNYDSVTIEVTDLVMSTNGDEFSFIVFLGNSEIEAFSATAIVNGFKTNSIVDFYLPLTIPFSLSFSDYLPISSTQTFDTSVSDGLYSLNINNINTKIDQGFGIIQLKALDCIYDYVMMWWIDFQGKEKAWIFKKNIISIGSKKQLEIDTGDNYYKQYRAKDYGCQIIHRNADHTTQMYLSDMVHSDDIYIIFPDEKIKIPVKIEETKFDVQRGKKDIVFNVNIAHYDTI